MVRLRVGFHSHHCGFILAEASDVREHKYETDVLCCGRCREQLDVEVKLWGACFHEYYVCLHNGCTFSFV